MIDDPGMKKVATIILFRRSVQFILLCELTFLSFFLVREIANERDEIVTIEVSRPSILL